MKGQIDQKGKNERRYGRGVPWGGDTTARGRKEVILKIASQKCNLFALGNFPDDLRPVPGF